MRLPLVLAALAGLAACASSPDKRIDPGDSGGGTGSAQSTSSGKTTGSSAGTTGSSGSTGTLATASPGFGDFQAGFSMTVSEARLTTATPGALTAVLIEQPLDAGVLCDGDVLDGITTDPRATFVTLVVPGTDGGNIPPGVYPLGQDGGYFAAVYLSETFSDDGVPGFGPLSVDFESVAGSGAVTVTAYDGHSLTASASGLLALVSDGGGSTGFTCDLSAFDCH